MRKNQESCRALLGSLLLSPGLFTEVSHLVIPEMFPVDHRAAAEFIWKQEQAGIGYDIANVADAAGWSRDEKQDILAAANPDIIVNHASQIRDAYVSNLDAAILEQAAAELRESGRDRWEVISEMDYRRAKVTAGVPGYRNNKGDLITAAQERIAQALNCGGLSGIPTGWADLDEFLGGWQPGNFVVIGARPGMGKTTVMMHHARAAAMAGHPVAILTLEMTGVELASKWIAEACGITTGRLRSGQLGATDLDAIQEQAGILYDLPVVFEDFADVTPTGQTVRDRMRTIHDREGCKIFFLDYLQLINGDDPKKSRNYQIEEVSRAMKQTAKQLDCTVIGLSQLSRKVEQRGGSKRPMLSDFRDSGSVEQDIDLGILLYRPEYYSIMEDENGESLVGVLEYRVAKDRAGGIPTTFRRWWRGAQYHENRHAPGRDFEPEPDHVMIDKRTDLNIEVPF